MVSISLPTDNASAPHSLASNVGRLIAIQCSTMMHWCLSWIFLGIGIRLIGEGLAPKDSFLGIKKQQRNLIFIQSILRELEETLMAGLVPENSRWDVLHEMPEPWSSLSSESLGELRSSGGSLLPTLQRLRGLAEEHGLALEDARAKSAQAFLQALVCSSLVPIVGSALYVLLPGVQQNYKTWIGACLTALGVMAMGVFWLLRLAEAARWGGLPPSHRSWVLSSQCAGERFLAYVRMGTPADLAWSRAIDFLSLKTPDLASAWGNSIWNDPNHSAKGKAEEVIIGAGTSIRKSVQVSIMEGRPCLDRVEVALRGLRQNLKLQVERELSLLGTVAMKPLFLCVAPAIFGLLFMGLWLSSSEYLQDSVHGF